MLELKSKLQNRISSDSSLEQQALEPLLDFWWLSKEESSTFETWYFKTDNHSSPSLFKVNWSPTIIGVESSEFGRWFFWREYAKHLTIAVMESGLTTVNKPITLASYARVIRAVCQWFCFSAGLNHIGDVEKVHIEDFEMYLKSLQLHKNTIETRLNILNLMWNLKDFVGTGLKFLCYYQGKLKQKARKIGVNGKRTKSIHPLEFLKLIDIALMEIEKSTIWLAKLQFYVVLKAKYGASSSIHYKEMFNESSSEVINKIRLIYASAIIVILSLTAMRKHEATVLKYSDAVKAIEEREGLEGIEHKTSKTETGKPTKRVLNNSGYKALKIILAITSYSRESTTEKDRLLLRVPFQHSVSGGTKPSEYVNTRVFYGLMDHFTQSNLVKYKLRPHMLRKAFSLLWAWRFEIGDLEYLSNFLSHNTLDFTKAYIEDPDAIEYLPEEMQRYSATVMEDAFLGHRNIKGGASKIIDKYFAAIRKKVSVVEPEFVQQFVSYLIQKQGYLIIPNADGYCFMAKGRGFRAKCSTDGQNPNYANRNEKHCSSCPNFGVDKSRVEYWTARKNAHQIVTEKSSDEMLIKASREGIAIAEKIIALFKDVT